MESQGAFPLALPVLKFSYVTTTAGRTSPLSWTHISGRADLVAIFDQILIREDGATWAREKRILKVLRGSDTLEDLDLDALAREAATSSSSQIQISNAKTPVAVIVKSPCLAIRYPTRVNQIRRFQLKFSSDIDFTKAVSILSETGCPITESSAGECPPSAAGLQTRLDVSTWPHNATSPSLGTTTPHVENHIIRPVTAMSLERRPSTVGSSSTLCTAPPSRNAPKANNDTVSQHQNTVLSHERPSTAPMFPDPESLSQLLPPKRELPFARPQRRQQRYAPPNPTRTNAIANPEIREVRPRTHTGGISMREPFQSSVAHSNLDNNESAGCGNETSSFQSSDLSPSKRSLENIPDLSPTRFPKSFIANSPNGNHLNNTDTQPHSRPSDIPIQLPPPTNAPRYDPSPEPPQIPQQQASQQPTSANPSSSTSVISPRLSAILTTADFSSYLTTPTSQRSALVESWVCEQLESDGFLALCQDVEGVWKRIAFGL